MRLVSLLGGRIVGVREHDGVVELIIDKDSKRYTVLFRGDIDYYRSDCTLEDEGCYDVIVVYEVRENEGW